MWWALDFPSLWRRNRSVIEKQGYNGHLLKNNVIFVNNACVFSSQIEYNELRYDEMNITYTNSNEFILSPKQMIQISTSTSSKHCLYLTKLKINLINRWVKISYTNLFFSLHQLTLHFYLCIAMRAVTGSSKSLKNIQRPGKLSGFFRGVTVNGANWLRNTNGQCKWNHF